MIEKIGNIELNTNFWDCECSSNYIHSIVDRECSLCGAEREDQPYSRALEVRKNIYES